MQKYNKNYALIHSKSIKEQAKKRRFKNRDKYREYDRKRYQENSEFHRNRWKKYSRTHRSIINKRRRERYATDVEYKLRCVIRARLISTIKQGQKNGSILTHLGCSVAQLKTHLEKQFKPGMNWENWSYKGWHIDHIKPISLFKENPLKACHYTNLQPLWSMENHVKGNRI